MTDSNETIMYESGYNAGYVKGINESLDCKTNKLNINTGDILVYSYDKTKNTCEEVGNVYNLLSEQYPDYHIIAIPDTTSLKSCNMEELENIFSHIFKSCIFKRLENIKFDDGGENSNV